MLQQGKLYEKVIPIIEPVRFNSTFLTTVQKFIDANRKLVIIRNPKVGSFENDIESLKIWWDEEREATKDFK